MASQSFLSDKMGGYYVIFNGRHAGIYESWGECSKYIVGKSGIRHQKYSTYDQALWEFEHFNDGAIEASNDDPEAPLLLPAISYDNYGWWKNVVIVSLVFVVLAMGCALYLCNRCN